jgi:hypothetical protein
MTKALRIAPFSRPAPVLPVNDRRAVKSFSNTRRGNSRQLIGEDRVMRILGKIRPDTAADEKSDPSIQITAFI